MHEEKAPYGYASNTERIPVKIEASGGNDAVNIVKVSAADQRSPASVHVSKVDNGGNRVEGAVFALYADKALARKLGEYTTSANGTFDIENLTWGTYYLKEVKASKGYLLDSLAHEIVLGKDTTIDAQLELLNEQKRGSVELTKTDETETLRLSGAVFDLYKTDGTLVKNNLRTGPDGTLLVEGLEWGGYYFRETKAPAGYGLSKDLIRFSVNATTGGIKQEVAAVNYPETREVHVTKRIQAADLHWEHGAPTFLFQLTGTTADGEAKAYTQTVTFSERYVSERTDARGYVEATASFLRLKAGTYACEEIPVQRYELKEIREVSDNGTIRGKTVDFDLTNSALGSATFVNEKTDWRDYSDTTSVTNLVKMTKKLTAIIVERAGPEVLEGNSLFDKKNLIVTAVYDDGSERVLGSDEYTPLNGDGTLLEHVSKVAGTYTAKVSYTEKGITRTGTFDYTVKAAKKLTVRFDSSGGDSLSDLAVYQYDRLQDYAAASYTPARAAHTFTGWYSDAALTKAFSTSTPITTDLTLYAKWDRKHLNACSWKEIKAVADAGTAESVFGECFAAVKKDLAADGVLSSGNYQHTKAFTYQGKTYHAMIAGFGHDTKATGSKAGITFLVYEKAGNARMNDEDTNLGGWGKSTMRTETLARLLSGLPAEMKTVIASVEKTTATKSASGALSLETTTDKLWLPSQAELYGAWGYETTALKKSDAFSDTDYGYLKSLKGEGSQYALFQGSVPDGVQLKETALTRGSRYWTRSLIPTVDGYDGFCGVDDVGGAQ